MFLMLILMQLSFITDVRFKRLLYSAAMPGICFNLEFRHKCKSKLMCNLFQLLTSNYILNCLHMCLLVLPPVSVCECRLYSAMSVYMCFFLVSYQSLNSSLQYAVYTSVVSYQLTHPTLYSFSMNKLTYQLATVHLHLVILF